MTKRRLRGPVGWGNRDDFRRMVAAEAPMPVPLGLTHVTTGYILRDILDRDKGKLLAITPCDVIGEPVIYAFYGRAAFRLPRDDEPTDLHFLFPVVFVIDPASAPSPKHLFGFDSGAFVNRYMDDYLHKEMPLFDFELQPDVQTATRLVRRFFGGHHEFLKNTPLTDAGVPDDNFEAYSYSRLVLAGGRGANRLDDRVSTPELLFDEPIDIATAVRAVVLPDVLAETPSIGGRIEAAGVRVDPYEWKGVSRPSEYHMLIRGQVKQINQDLRWLSGP